MHEIGISAKKTCVRQEVVGGEAFAGKKNERPGTRTKESRRRPVAP